MVLLDFDRARTYDKNTITAEQQEWLREDVQIVEDLCTSSCRCLSLAWEMLSIDIPDSLMISRKMDVAEGGLNHSYLYICT